MIYAEVVRTYQNNEGETITEEFFSAKFGDGGLRSKWVFDVNRLLHENEWQETGIGFRCFSDRHNAPNNLDDAAHEDLEHVVAEIRKHLGSVPAAVAG